MRNVLLFLISIFFGLISCKKPVQYDLIIENAKVFDVKTGNVIDNQTILIGADTIAGIIESGEPVRTKKVIDADGRLVTPGNIDTKTHLAYAFNGRAKLPSKIPSFLNHFYHKRFSDFYLPFGVTSVLETGQPDSWLPQTNNWISGDQHRFVDLLLSGRIFTSQPTLPVNDPTFVQIEDPAFAKQHVIDRSSNGLKYIVFYNLDEPSLQSTIRTADSLNIEVISSSSHQNSGILDAVKLGVRNFDQAISIPLSLYNETADKEIFQARIDSIYKGENLRCENLINLEIFRYITDFKADKLEYLVDELAKSNVSFSTSIHKIAEMLNLSWFKNPEKDSFPDNSDIQMERGRENFTLLMQFVKKIFDKGITIRIGTDCPNGGKAVLSEQLLLAQAGFSIPDIISISTINGAKMLRIDNNFGSLEVGKKANLIIYDQNPFDNYRNFLSKKKVIKDGHFYKTIKRNPGAKISGN